MAQATSHAATAVAETNLVLTPGTVALKTGGRFNSIDLLRGLVMVIMALDHTRDFFHNQALTDDPLNLNTTTPLLFFTRYITHYCAPVFVFLAGASAFFQSLKKPKAALSAFLIKRGLWLALIEVTVVTLGITFDPGYHVIILQTIWSIGISMVLLGLAVRLPFAAVLTLGALIVLGHNALDFYEAKGPTPAWYNLLHRPGGVPLGDTRFVMIAYPFLPWTGLMMLGYCFGRMYVLTVAEKRRRLLLLLGMGLLVLFALVRYTNAYGDPQPWSAQKSGLYTFFSFLNVTKYPPSLLYMCITIGPALLFLALAGNARGRLSRIITVYGRVPFFYYILHFYLLHLVATAAFFSRGHSFAEGWKGVFAFKFAAAGEGYSLGVVYLVWFTVVASLYPLCLWFSRYKQTHKQWWLSYL